MGSCIRGGAISLHPPICATSLAARSVDTTPVDRYPKGASPYGALDMAGNVWEWTRSLWGKDRQPTMFGYPSALYGYPYNYNPTDGREDLEAANDVRRVVRGGSYVHHDRYVRCAYRDSDFPSIRDSYIGFRLVCVSPPSCRWTLRYSASRPIRCANCGSQRQAPFPLRPKAVAANF